MGPGCRCSFGRRMENPRMPKKALGGSVGDEGRRHTGWRFARSSKQLRWREGHECRGGARKVEGVGGVGRDGGGGGRSSEMVQETGSLRAPVGAGGGIKEREATVFDWEKFGGSGSDTFWKKKRRGCLRGFGGA